MDKLCKFIDRELEDLENKAAASGKLSSAEVNYGKDLAKFKMALLTNEAMENEGYSNEYMDGMSNRGGSYEGGGSYRGGNRGGSSYRGMSNARGRGSRAKRDSMGRYSSEDGYSHADAKEDFIEEVYELMEKAPDEHTRKKFERFVSEIK